jgi:hypothetical protein
MECIPPGMMPAVQIYLLNVISGLNLTPAQLIDAAKCFECARGMFPEIEAYLLCNIANK